MFQTHFAKKLYFLVTPIFDCKKCLLTINCDFIIMDIRHGLDSNTMGVHGAVLECKTVIAF